MLFPWKKNKVTRISQIVADLQSPKRGGSLVVETGFPTSLIDLFVKNRSRFRKRKSKKWIHLEISDPLPPVMPPAPPPSPPEPSSSTNLMVVFAESRYTEAPRLRRLVRENVHEYDGVADSGQDLNRVGECAGGCVANMVLAAIFKMFVVAILTLSVEKLTVGITMSAFVLLFLEYVGKHILCFLNLKPCSNANMAFGSLKRVSCSFWCRKLALKRRKNCEGSEPAIVHEEEVFSGFVRGVELSSASLSIEEIKIEEAKSQADIHCKETNFAGPELNSLNRDKKLVFPEIEEDSERKVVEQFEISECKTKGKHSANFKSKLVKKLVPKKFRALKKQKKEKKEKNEKKSKEREAESSSEVSSTMEGDISSRFRTEEEQEDVSKLDCIKDDEVGYGMNCSNESTLAKEEVAVTVNNAEGRIDGVGSSGYIILILIALAGLVGGRLLALLLIMAWCFMLKMVKTRGTSVNVPLVKCFYTNHFVEY